MFITVSNDSVEFSIKAPVEECVSFFEKIAKKTTNKLYHILVDAIGKESVVCGLKTNFSPSVCGSPLMLVDYLNEKNTRLEVFINWKEDHWEVYHPQLYGYPSMLDTSIGRSADGLPTFDEDRLPYPNDER